MKLCCGWCYRIYTPTRPDLVKDPSNVFCSKGCYDANKLFIQLVEKDHLQLIRARLALKPRQK
jgi:hypothetical protein